MSPARSPIRPRASITSDGFWTKDSATQSTPSSRPKARSARSLAVSGDRSRRVPGRFTPLRFEIVPAVITSASRAAVSIPTTRTRTRPSSISRSWPGTTASKISGWCRGIASLPPSAPSRTKRTRSPAARSRRPSRTVPIRIFGPWRSCRMPIGRPTSRSRARMAACTLAWSACVPWLKLRRKVSTPARNRAFSISGLSVAGPTVATILA